MYAYKLYAFQFQTPMLDPTNDSTTTTPCSAGGNPMAGQMAIEEILRSGDNPHAEEFIALCTTFLHPPSMGF